MNPFHPVDLFELFQCHTGIKELELGRGTIEGELGFPLLSVRGREGASDRTPFGDTQSAPL
jgi:hypothetical protein